MISGSEQQNTIAKLEEWKALVDSTETKGANLGDKFLFYVLAAFSITYTDRKATNCHVFLRMVGEVEISRDWSRSSRNIQVQPS